MRIIYILLLVSLCCLVGAKYLPDESASRALLRNVRSTRDDLDNISNSKSNESNDDNDDDNDDESDDDDDNDSLERRRQQEIQKLERKRDEEQRKLQEKREKEERKRQEEQEKEQRKREKIEAKFEEEKRKLVEKLQKEERKRKEKIEKEERKRIAKIAEEEHKHQEKLAKEERKRQEKINKMLDVVAQETVILQNNPNESVESEEDLDFEDIWKNYIYEKYGLAQTSTNLEKNVAINRYIQEELGLNANSTKTEYRQAVLQLVQNQIAVPSSSQNGFKNYLASHVNAAYIQKLQTEIEGKIAELDNDTVLLQNVSLPWGPEARYAIQQKKTILTSIAQYLSTILPNWITGGNSSSNVDLTNSTSEVSTDNTGISSSNINNAAATNDANAISTEGSTIVQGPATDNNGLGLSDSVVTDLAGSTANTLANAQDNINTPSNTAESETNNINDELLSSNDQIIDPVDSSSVITTESGSNSVSLNNQPTVSTNTISNGVEAPISSVPSGTDTNVEVPIESTDSNNTAGGLDSNTISNSDVSVSNTVIASSTSVDVPALDVDASANNIETTVGETLNNTVSLNNQPAVSTNTISNGVEAPISSVPSGTDMNVEVPIGSTDSIITAGELDSNTISNSDVSVSNTVIASSTSVDVPALEFDASANNIEASVGETANTINFESNKNQTVEVTESIIADGSNAISGLSGTETTEVSNSVNSGTINQSVSGSSNTAILETPAGETLVDNSSAIETSTTGTQIITQSTNNIVPSETVSVVNSDSTTTQQGNSITSIDTTSVDSLVDNAPSVSDSTVTSISDLSSTGPQENVGINTPSVDIPVSSTSSDSNIAVSGISDVITTETVLSTESAAETTFVVNEGTSNTVDFTPTLIEGSTIINTVENSVNVDTHNNQVGVSGLVNADSTGTNIIGENTSSTVVSSASEAPLVTDSNSVTITQAFEETSTAPDITINNSVASTGTDFPLNSSNSTPNDIEITSATDSGILSTGIETVTTSDIDLAVTTTYINPQDTISVDNTLTDITTAATEIIVDNAVPSATESINNVTEHVPDLQPESNKVVNAVEIASGVGIFEEVPVTVEGVALTDGTNINTQDTTVAANEVNISEINGTEFLTTDASIAITEATVLSSDSNNASALGIDNSVNLIDLVPSISAPETVVAEVGVSSESPVITSDIVVVSEEPVVATINVTSADLGTTAGVPVDNANGIAASETVQPPTEPASVTVVVLDGNFNTESPVVSPIGNDISVIDTTDPALVSTDGFTVSNINTEPTEIPVNNTPVLSSNDTTTPEQVTSSVSTGTADLKSTKIEATGSQAQDNLNVPTVFPNEAGASLLEVTQQ